MESLLNLKNHVTIVTGASRGIGAEIARAHARAGSNLMITARTEDQLIALAKEIEHSYKVKCLVHVGDIQDEKSVHDLYKKVQSEYGRVDHLVANAGVLADRVLGMIKPDFVDHAFRVNVQGVISHLQLASRLMQKHGGGSITVMSSIVGRYGCKGQTVYAATKAALIGVVLSAAKELGPHNIRVNAIAPGLIDTDMIKGIPLDIKKSRMEAIPLSRVGTTLDVAHVSLFLSSDLARYVTGQIIGVDGGMVL